MSETRLPDLRVFRNKLMEGYSPIEVYEQWTRGRPDATDQMKADVRAGIAMVWKDARAASTRGRSWKR